MTNCVGEKSINQVEMSYRILIKNSGRDLIDVGGVRISNVRSDDTISFSLSQTRLECGGIQEMKTL